MASITVVKQAAMDGCHDDGRGVLYGPSPVRARTLSQAVDEGQLADKRAFACQRTGPPAWCLMATDTIICDQYTADESNNRAGQRAAFMVTPWLPALYLLPAVVVLTVTATSARVTRCPANFVHLRGRSRDEGIR